jgi:hypothetical protein
MKAMLKYKLSLLLSMGLILSLPVFGDSGIFNEEANDPPTSSGIFAGDKETASKVFESPVFKDESSIHSSSNPFSPDDTLKLKAPPLPGDVGGNLTPLGNDWIILLLISFLYLLFHRKIFRKS